MSGQLVSNSALPYLSNQGLEAMAPNLKVDKPFQRDPRIDFCRGIALLVILVDHIELLTGVRWISYYTPHGLGPVDALDVFVFLSGYVFGLVYARTLTLEGYWRSQRKALRRVRQLYIAHVTTYFLVLLIVACLPVNTRLLHAGGFAEAMNALVVTSLRAIALTYQPFGFDILPLYIVLLLLMLPILALMRHNALVAFLISYAVYALTQFIWAFNLPLYGFGPVREKWLFNPFAWQFLFVIAIGLSIFSENAAIRILKCRWVLVLSLIIVVVVSAAFQIRNSSWGSFPNDILPFTNKSCLGPLRLLYFLCLVRIAYDCIPARTTFWQSKAAAMVLRCGQHSLLVFCFGLLLAYLCLAWQQLADLSERNVKLTELGAVITSIALANVLPTKYTKMT